MRVFLDHLAFAVAAENYLKSATARIALCYMILTCLIFIQYRTSSSNSALEKTSNTPFLH